MYSTEFLVISWYLCKTIYSWYLFEEFGDWENILNYLNIAINGNESEAEAVIKSPYPVFYFNKRIKKCLQVQAECYNGSSLS